MFNRLSLWLLSVCCLAPVTTEAFAQKGGGGTTPPPPLPNVRYQVVEFRKLLSPEDVWVNQINNAGMIVGRFANSAFIYDQPRGLLYKLNEEQSLPLKLDAEFGSIGSSSLPSASMIWGRSLDESETLEPSKQKASR